MLGQEHSLGEGKDAYRPAPVVSPPAGVIAMNERGEAPQRALHEILICRLGSPALTSMQKGIFVQAVEQVL